MKEIAQLREEIEHIKARNKRVEADKAWETSYIRNIAIAISNYLLIFIFLLLIQDPHPYLNALVAALAYLISTSSLGAMKTWWLARRK
jgi:hypothetical protein